MTGALPQSCGSTSQDMNATIIRAQKLAYDAGLGLSLNKVKRIVQRAWNTNPEMTDTELFRCITYADPTGDTAVRNAMKKNSGRCANSPGVMYPSTR